MRILIAPTAFKGSLSPLAVARAMQVGVDLFHAKYHEDISTDILPLADGGDGTVESIYASCGGELQQLNVTGAFGEVRQANWLLLGSVAFVELASASGISGWNFEQLRPLDAHTTGLGEVMLAAMESNQAKTIIISLGGSASTDGGSAAVSVLGAKFYDAIGQVFKPVGGKDLEKIHSIDLSQCLELARKTKFVIATDVENVLLGDCGAAHIFGPQKGCTPADVKFLDASLAKYADVLEQTAQRDGARNIPGAGAAGGTGFGLSVALNAEIVSGFDYLAGMIGLSKRVESAEIIFTGEGRIDSSTLSGKAVGSLQKLAKQHGKKLWAFSGAAISDNESLLRRQFDNLVSIASPGEYADQDKIAHSVFQELERYRNEDQGSDSSSIVMK